MYVLSFFKKGDTIQQGTFFKGGQYLRKYGKWVNNLTKSVVQKLFLQQQCGHPDQSKGEASHN